MSFLWLSQSMFVYNISQENNQIVKLQQVTAFLELVWKLPFFTGRVYVSKPVLLVTTQRPYFKIPYDCHSLCLCTLFLRKLIKSSNFSKLLVLRHGLRNSMPNHLCEQTSIQGVISSAMKSLYPFKDFYLECGAKSFSP